MSNLFSIAYWIYLGLSSIVLFGGALVLCALTAPLDRRRRLLHRYTCWWSTLYLRCLPGCRIIVCGRDNIAPNTPYILASNHQSMTDIMALAALATPFKWVSKKEVFRLPCIGWNMMLNQYVCVDRGNIRSVRATMESCKRWLDLGVPLMMFPEGHRSPTGELIDFHDGAFRLAASAQCAVVPIVVDGTHPIYRGLRVKPFPGTITIQVLKPMFADGSAGSAQRLREQVFQMMKQELKRMRNQPLGH